MSNSTAIDRVVSELRDGMAMAKCRQCGCMKDALLGMQAALATPDMAEATALAGQIEGWAGELQPVKYACLGCDYCIAAAATNLFAQAFPNAIDGPVLSCAFEVKQGKWPGVPGEYLLLDIDLASVAVSTLGSLDLPEQVAALRPAGLALVGKTETENIGLDKIIKNAVTNPALRYLILAGRDAEGHFPGQTLLALSQNGVDDKLRVIGSRGKRPVLRNVTREEIEAFRQQVQVVDMIGCDDAAAIAARVAELAGESLDGCSDPACSCHTQPRAALPIAVGLSLAPVAESCGCDGSCREATTPGAAGVPVIQAQAPTDVALDKAGYFVVIVQRDRGIIVTEHYGYDNTLNGMIEGKDARSIYWTAIGNAWVSELSHAAYLGKELARAELALQTGGRYVQDGA
jgi:tetrahydromethanopterin S-methyltransferase subunit A